MSKPEVDLQTLLEFLYQVPLGLIKIDGSGQINLINAKAMQLLETVANDAQIQNLFEVIKDDAFHGFFIRSIKNKAMADPESFRIEFSQGESSKKDALTYRFDTIELGSKFFLVSVQDISEDLRRDALIRQKMQKEASDQGKFEALTHIIHDIGNAVAGIGAKISKCVDMTSMEEIDALIRLEDLFNGLQSELGPVIGEEKALAVPELVGAVREGMREKLTTIQDSMQVISSSIEHVNQIIDLHRNTIKDGRKQPRKMVNLLHCLEDALVVTDQILALNKISIQKDFAKNFSGRIKGDPTNLTQVFVNIIKNATEAMQESSLKILSIAFFERNGQQTVVFKDTGCGCSKENLERVFDKDFTGKSNGLGVGLAGCAKIIESHSGGISMTSEGVGKGAQMTIVLPAVEERGDHAA